VSRRSWVLFLLLSAFWGASYMFIKVALDDGVPPAVIVFVRTALAALVLLPVAVHMRALAHVRDGGIAPIAALALLQVVGPFLLISFGEQEISSSLTGILIATAPIFTFLLAFAIDHEERAGPAGLVGVAVGIAGVALLLGVDAGGSGGALAGGLMVVLAALGYALGAYYFKRRFAHAQPVGAVATTMVASALMSAPVAALDLPESTPGLDAVASLAALGLLGTGVSFILYYVLIATIGPAKSSLVAYVAPCFAVGYGVTLLDERFTLATAAGLALILGGSWLAAEGRLPRSSGARRELAAGGIDVPAAGQADGRPHAGRLESELERRDRLARRASEA
jgi:drug/metabolite transporter (DMT)-like permease